MSGTDLAYGTTRPRFCTRDIAAKPWRGTGSSPPTACYAMSGTDLSYAAIGLGLRYAMSGTDLVYAATESASTPL
eukprot:3940745-Rhodomonas_salina.23